jgi:hypothetical protein
MVLLVNDQLDAQILIHLLQSSSQSLKWSEKLSNVVGSGVQ